MKTKEFQCSLCAKLFIREMKDQRVYKNKYCSRECSNKAKITSVTTSCKNCNKEVVRLLNQFNKSKNSFCNNSCAAKYNNTHKTTGTRRSKLETYLEEQIRKYYPDIKLLCNSKEAINSELDFYFPELKLAIELNGILHYEPIYGEDKFTRIVDNDKQKLIACYNKGIELAVIDSSTCNHLTVHQKDKFWKIVKSLLDRVI